MALAQFPLVEQRYGHQPLRISKGSVIQTHGAFPALKGAPWLKEFNGIINHLVQGGIVTRLINKYILLKYLQRERLTSPPPEAFKLEHIALVLMVWAEGISISTICFVLEILQRNNGKIYI